MPAINWAFLCDYASVDAAGKAYIIGIFEYVNVPKLPRRWPQLYVAMEVQTAGNENFKLSAQISAPSGKEASKKIIIPYDAQKFGGRARKGFVSFAFFNTVFQEEGEYHIQLFLDDRLIHHLPLTIRLRQNKNTPPVTSPNPNLPSEI